MAYLEEIPEEFNGNNKDGYMDNLLGDLSEIPNWLVSLDRSKTREYEKFLITDHIDNKKIKNRDVALVEARTGFYPEHIHDNSDSFFVIYLGEGSLLINAKEIFIKAGDKIKIPKGTPHGFKVGPGGFLSFVTFVNPPIWDEEGKVDFHF